MSRWVLTCVALFAAFLLAPSTSRAQPHVQDELNRAKAALQLKKFDEAARRFGALAERGNADAQFSMGANRTAQPVTCLVPAIDWNPKTWQDC